MKQIETLLQRYRNGEITPEEQAELNRLTHRDEILNAAASRAAKIRRQRTTVVSSVASVVIVAAVFLTITANNSTPTADTPLLAQNVIEVNDRHFQFIAQREYGRCEGCEFSLNSVRVFLTVITRSKGEEHRDASMGTGLIDEPTDISSKCIYSILTLCHLIKYYSAVSRNAQLSVRTIA